MMGDEAVAARSQVDLEMDEALTAFVDAAMRSSHWGVTQKGKAPNEKRDCAAAHAKVVNDCFNGRDSLHNEVDFERGFGMPRVLVN